MAAALLRLASDSLWPFMFFTGLHVKYWELQLVLSTVSGLQSFAHKTFGFELSQSDRILKINAHLIVFDILSVLSLMAGSIMC